MAVKSSLCMDIVVLDNVYSLITLQLIYKILASAHFRQGGKVLYGELFFMYRVG